MADFEHTHARVHSARYIDISQLHLDDQNFRQCEESKNDSCDFLLRFIDHLKIYAESESPTYIEHLLTRVIEQVKSLETGIDDIRNFIKPGNATCPFQDFRLDQIKQFREKNLAIHSEFIPVMAWMEARKLGSDQGYLDRFKADCDSSLRDLRVNVESARADAAILKKELEIITNSRAAINFQARADEHGEHQKYWMFGAATCSVFMVIALFSFWSGVENSGTKEELLKAVISKATAVALLGVFFKICLTRYSSERNLYVIYRHRNSVLELHRTGDSQLDSDPEARHQMRLEIAKIIYSDPETGMIKSPGEFNFSPVMNAIEKSSA